MTVRVTDDSTCHGSSPESHERVAPRPIHELDELSGELEGGGLEADVAARCLA